MWFQTSSWVWWYRGKNSSENLLRVREKLQWPGRGFALFNIVFSAQGMRNSDGILLCIRTEEGMLSSRWQPTLGFNGSVEVPQSRSVMQTKKGYLGGADSDVCEWSRSPEHRMCNMFITHTCKCEFWVPKRYGVYLTIHSLPLLLSLSFSCFPLLLVFLKKEIN